MVLYSHFRSEHLLVPSLRERRDAVTARYGEGFHSFFLRVLSPLFLRFGQKRNARQNLPWYDLSNPFFVYWGLQSIMLLLAMVLGGWGRWPVHLAGICRGLDLELVNYVEHYGLTRKHLGEGNRTCSAASFMEFIP